MEVWKGVTKSLQGLVSHELTDYLSFRDLFLIQWIMTILTKGCKPDNFEWRNSLKLSFTNIRDLRSNFVECESFFESNFPDILALCFQLSLLHSVSYFFFLYWLTSSSFCMFFSSNIGKVLTINPSVNVFVFGQFNAYHKANLFWWDW